MTQVLSHQKSSMTWFRHACTAMAQVHGAQLIYLVKRGLKPEPTQSKPNLQILCLQGFCGSTAGTKNYFLQVHNLGNQIRVTWKQAEPSTATVTLGSFYGQPDATGPINIPGTNTTAGLAETALAVTPIQFHFHTTSEHTLEGRFAPLELHLVTNATAANTSCANNCTAVFGVLYDFSPDGLEGTESNCLIYAIL